MRIHTADWPHRAAKTAHPVTDMFAGVLWAILAMQTLLVVAAVIGIAR